MTTPCTIFYKSKEGSYQGIYCRFNGMIDYTADILYHHYQDETLVKQLIQLGAILYLKEDIRTIKPLLRYERLEKEYKYCQVKWKFSSEEEMIEAWKDWKNTDEFLGSYYIYLYDATKKGKNKWEIFYFENDYMGYKESKLVHQNITPSLIRKWA